MNVVIVGDDEVDEIETEADHVEAQVEDEPINAGEDLGGGNKLNLTLFQEPLL